MDKYFWKDKIVAVTGGSGFIGSHFVEELANASSKVKCLYSNNNSNIKYLKKNNKKIEFIQLDLLNKTKLLKSCKNVNTIINCAAKDGNSEYKSKNAATILDTNIQIVSNILNCSLKNNISNITLVSSAEIYPLTSVSPIKESDDYTTKFDNLENGYVLSKRYSEIMGKMYSKQYKINIFFPRPTNTYGERDKFDNNNRVIPMLIKKIINKEEIEIWGDGKQERSFIYVKDLVWGVLNMIEKNKYKFLNISTNQSITINKLALLISEIVGNKAKVHYKLNKTAGLKKRSLDIDNFKSIINFDLKDIEYGLSKTIEWYKKNIS